MKTIIKGILVVLVIMSFLANAFQFIDKNKVMNEIETASLGFDPTHKCEGRSYVFPDGLYCYSLSSSLKTCYTLPDRKGGKRCLVEPFWEEIEYEELICPIWEETICPEPIVCPEPITCPTIQPCIQTCKGCGDCGGGTSCPSCPTCPSPFDCEDVRCVAYVDNDEGGVDKYACDKCGSDARCVKDGTLEMPWG